MTKTEIFYGLAVIALSAPGFWQYFISPLIEKRRKKISPQDAALIGLLHERLHDEWRYYKKRFDEGRGISKARYEYLDEHIYGPYKALGGNSNADEMMKDMFNMIDER